MPFVALHPEQHANRVVGNGHCVAFVRSAAPHLPPTSRWIEGAPVWDTPDIEPGTAIATFGSRGTYENKTDGSSHAAILIENDEEGILVWDQWQGRPVERRLILFKGGHGPACDDADAYAVIEIA